MSLERRRAPVSAGAPRVQIAIRTAIQAQAKSRPVTRRRDPMGAFKRTAAPCQTPGIPSFGEARPHRGGDPFSTIVEGGGVVRLADREYHAAALARYDGRRVHVRPTAAVAVLEVRIDGRLLCHASLIGPGDDDTGSVPACVPRSPRGGGESARLRLPSDAASRRLGSARSEVYAAAALATVSQHHEPRRSRSAQHLLGHPRPSNEQETPTVRTGGGSARRRTPHVLTAPARGPPRAARATDGHWRRHAAEPQRCEACR